ncbi:MAG: UDP-N-acetylmuramoyl-L-alanine--D-glutamate ligase [Ruminococcaceae bacterium]|nr:UDP-N-acetylmuramoyl-L-alanine--D-glutamate ligase [Oscillospiraceae bacterium]
MTLHEYISSIKDKKVAVVGLGVSNAPLIERLLNGGCSVRVCDRSAREAIGVNADKAEAMGAVLTLGEGYLDDLDADIIFRTPGMRPDVPAFMAAREKGSVITSEMEVFFELCPCRIIAVTGSDGKTTTTTIISKLLEAAGYNVHVGGNIGTPLLCRVDDMKPDDIVVLELSSFQLMTISKSPDIAVVTNLAPNHLDIHTDMDEYTEAKKNIFKYQKKGDRLVLNMDNDITRSFEMEKQCDELFWFSRKTKVDGSYLDGDKVFFNGEAIIDTKDILIPGVHNVENYMAAFAAVHGLVSPDICRKVAMEFGGVEHRIELVRRFNGASYYNDSIASSPSRTIAGLRSFNKKVILIAGGKDKGVPFDVLGDEVINHVKTLVVTGFTAEKIRDAVLSASSYNGQPEIIHEPDFKDAVIAASKVAVEGDVVLLSPACTSFDHFKNFAERGNYFKEIVRSL